jgi:hypothetical protein
LGESLNDAEIEAERAGGCLQIPREGLDGGINECPHGRGREGEGGTPLPHPLNDRRGEGHEPFERAGEPALARSVKMDGAEPVVVQIPCASRRAPIEQRGR